jgi:hypothetical protein
MDQAHKCPFEAQFYAQIANMQLPEDAFEREPARKAKWRWEFLRRNSEYVADYQAIRKIRPSTELEFFYNGEICKLRNPSSLESIIWKERLKLIDFKLSDEINMELELVDKWSMPGLELLDPTMKFDEFDLETKKILVAILPNPVEVRLVPNEPSIHISVDYTMVNSLKECIDAVKREIHFYYDAFSQKGYLSCKEKMNYKPEQYKLYLAVGDMKAQNMKNWEIAAQLTPKEYKNNPESAIRNIAHYFKAYKDLVNGGFRNITWP